MFVVFLCGVRDPCSPFLAILTNYFSVWRWNYCVFISHFNNEYVFFKTACACTQMEPAFAFTGTLQHWRLQRRQSAVRAVIPPTGTALLQFLHQQLFHHMSSEVLKVFLILIFILVAYNQNNWQSQRAGLGNNIHLDSIFGFAKSLCELEQVILPFQISLLTKQLS